MVRIFDLKGNAQRLDGGAMFGNVPRALWSRWHLPDDQGRVLVACRAMLVDEGDRKLLFDAGVGAFFEPALRARYGVESPRHELLVALEALGLDDASIDVVVLSHLHFDHAGGLLKAHREGAAPELLFPRARFLVTRDAFERARAPHSRDRASFIPALPALLEASGRLELIGAEAATARLGERYRLRQTEGHTPGMLHATVLGEREQLFFGADLVPGMAWVHLPVTMGYDRCAERLVDEKAAVYEALTDRTSWLFFTHDPEVCVARLTRGEGGRWCGSDARATLGSGWELG